MPESVATAPVARVPAQQGFWAAATYCLLLLLVFHETAWSMVSIWLRSDTFAHGFLILPISLWLVWKKRGQLSSLGPRPALIVTLLALPVGFGWLLAWLVDVLVIQQLALVGLLILGVWAILGHEIGRLLAFPLGFLFFAVPMGEALIPPMMEFTATSTVWMIKQTGIPVFREGLYFMLPSGNWSVVEACSGVRYIIASVTLGVLYAYMTYRSFWRRGLFVLASIIMPIFANTARAYIIVMLGHMSDMTVATGADHLIYGWVFFGIVIMLLFWAGSFFREDTDDAAAAADAASRGAGHPKGPPRGLWPVSILALVAAGIWPMLSLVLQDQPASFEEELFDTSLLQGGWRADDTARWNWSPVSDVSGLVSEHLRKDADTVGVYVQYANDAGVGEELVGSIGSFVEQDSLWRVVEETRRTVKVQQREIPLVEALVTFGEERYLVWSWYRIGGRNIGNDYAAKFLEALSSLGLGSRGSYRVVIATAVHQDPQDGRAALLRFAKENAVDLGQLIDQAGAGE